MEHIKRQRYTTKMKIIYLFEYVLEQDCGTPNTDKSMAKFIHDQNRTLRVAISYKTCRFR